MQGLLALQVLTASLASADCLLGGSGVTGGLAEANYMKGDDGRAVADSTRWLRPNEVVVRQQLERAKRFGMLRKASNLINQ